MKPIVAAIISVVAGVAFFVVARSTNLFVERNAYTLYGLIVAMFVVPCIIAFLTPEKPWRWAILIVFGVLAGDVAAIFRDLAKDSTSHNIWPMELALLAVVATVCTLAGAFTGAHVSKRRLAP